MWCLFCFAVLCVLSSFAIISLGNRELVVYICCVLNVMLILSFLDFIVMPLGWYVVCDCGISLSYSLTFDASRPICPSQIYLTSISI